MVFLHYKMPWLTIKTNSYGPTLIIRKASLLINKDDTIYDSIAKNLNESTSKTNKNLTTLFKEKRGKNVRG